MLNARSDLIKEQWTGVMEARLVRDELIKCRRTEGVNSYTNCKHLADLYIDLLKTSGVSSLMSIKIAIWYLSSMLTPMYLVNAGDGVQEGQFRLEIDCAR